MNNIIIFTAILFHIIVYIECLLTFSHEHYSYRPKKFLRISKDNNYNPDDHYLSTTPARAEKACGYDLDDVDIAWLDVCNGERAMVNTS